MLALEALAATGKDVHKRIEEDKALAAVVPGSVEKKVEKKQAWRAHRRGSMQIAEQPRHWRAQPRGSSPSSPEQRRFFRVCSELPIGLRERRDHWSPKMGHVVKPGDIVSAARVEIEAGKSKHHEKTMWVQLRGEWGSGWVFDGLPNRLKCPSSVLFLFDLFFCCSSILLLLHLFAGTMTAKPSPPLLVEVDARVVATSTRSEGGYGIVHGYERDEITHCFRAIAAMAHAGVKAEQNDGAARSISRLAIEHCLPATWGAAKLDAFFAVHDRNADGRIDFDEFVEMYPTLRKQWRFEAAWAQFSLADESGAGVIGADDVHRIVPKGASAAECTAWLQKYDKHGHGCITLSDYLAVRRAVHRDFIGLAVGTSFVLSTYFVYSRVTKALLSVFSMEDIEGNFYLKVELGTPALTMEHNSMMVAAGIMLVCFSIGVPTVGLYCMYQVRKDISSRKVATIAGFLTDGYKMNVAWIWEFIVLGRKLVILAISLFIWDSFIQSFAAVIVLILAIVVQLMVAPFELPALNLLEVGALSSLLVTQLSGILLWYKQQPDKNDYLQPLQYAITAVLFFVNGMVLAGFAFVAGVAFLKEKSKNMIQILPATFNAFCVMVWLEDKLHWFVAGLFCPHMYTAKGARLLEEEWSFVIAARNGKLFDHGFMATQSEKLRRRKLLWASKFPAGWQCFGAARAERDTRQAWERRMETEEVIDILQEDSDKSTDSWSPSDCSNSGGASDSSGYEPTAASEPPGGSPHFSHDNPMSGERRTKKRKASRRPTRTQRNAAMRDAVRQVSFFYLPLHFTRILLTV